MAYGLIVFLASIALAVVYVFVTEAPLWAKAFVVGLMLASFLWRYGIFLQAGLGIFLSLYFTNLKSRSEWEQDTSAGEDRPRQKQTKIT